MSELLATVKIGSRVYGTHHENSDHDEVSLFRERGGWNRRRISLPTFLDGVRQGIDTCYVILWTPPERFTFLHDDFRAILAEREKLSSVIRHRRQTAVHAKKLIGRGDIKSYIQLCRLLTSHKVYRDTGIYPTYLAEHAPDAVAEIQAKRHDLCELKTLAERLRKDTGIDREPSPAKFKPAALFRVPLPVAEARLAACQGCDHWHPCHVCGAGQVKACKHPEQKARIHERMIDLAAMKCPAGKWGPSFPLRFDQHNLAPGVEGLRFNSSLIAWKDGYALAFRTGWRGSEIYVATLDRNLSPTGFSRKLELTDKRHKKHCGWGREDPRLFYFGDKLHVWFIGVRGVNGPTSVLFARLADDFRVEDVFYPDIPDRRPWEKNHAYFQFGDSIYAVYSIAPHRILKIEGNRATWAHETPTPALWHGGELRGGASPVRVGDEFWHFFHGRAQHQGRTAYNVGLYTFAARPPFEVLRIIPEPILWADHATKPRDQYVSCVFPCGAVRRGAEWLISMGEHDRWTVIHSFGHADLERQLVKVPR